MWIARVPGRKSRNLAHIFSCISVILKSSDMRERYCFHRVGSVTLGGGHGHVLDCGFLNRSARTSGFEWPPRHVGDREREKVPIVWTHLPLISLSPPPQQHARITSLTCSRFRMNKFISDRNMRALRVERDSLQKWAHSMTRLMKDSNCYATLLQTDRKHWTQFGQLEWRLNLHKKLLAESIVVSWALSIEQLLSTVPF